MNHDRLAQEVIMVLRGRRSQSRLSQELGFHSNVVSSWESGRRYPTATSFFRIIERSGVDVSSRLSQFHPRTKSISSPDLATPHGVAAWLQSLAGSTQISEISKRVGRDRFAVARWLNGRAEPKLGDYLRLIDACTRRLPDFLSLFLDPARLPEIANEWQTLLTARQGLEKLPWAFAVLQFLEFSSYRNAPVHQVGMIAGRLEITINEERECLEHLVRAGMIRWDEERWNVVQSPTLDLRGDPSALRLFAATWADVASARLRSGSPCNHAVNLFGVSREDLERIRSLQSEYFAQVREIVSTSSPTEEVAVLGIQLFSLCSEDSSQ